MEFLLNLFWLTLALPAIWMWRYDLVSAQRGGRFARVRPFLLFGCVLMLLFPVVSATDDLHAMRQEMEESTQSKRVVKHAAGDKSLARLNKAGSLPALVSPVAFGPSVEVCGRVLVVSPLLPHSEQFHEQSSRAPPFSFLG